MFRWLESLITPSRKHRFRVINRDGVAMVHPDDLPAAIEPGLASIRKAMKKLLDEKANRINGDAEWIPVEESLPDRHQPVFVLTTARRVLVGARRLKVRSKRVANISHEMWFSASGGQITGATHWAAIEIPKPPTFDNAEML